MRIAENDLLAHQISAWRATAYGQETPDCAELLLRNRWHAHSNEMTRRGMTALEALACESSFAVSIAEELGSRRARKIEFELLQHINELHRKIEGNARSDAQIAELESANRQSAERINALEARLADIYHADGRAVAMPRLKAEDADQRREVLALPICREHEQGRVYYGGELVTHCGSTYQAAKDTARDPPHDDWICLASAGRSFNIRGTFDPAKTYRSLDVVIVEGSTFVARRDFPGKCPGDGWQLLVGRGRTGKPGDRGWQGPAGPAGPRVEHLLVDDQGMLTLINSDGSTVECDFYPILSKIR